MIYLYKKTHNKTGMQYLGKTKFDPFRYPGSGIHWKRHLKKHGNDVTTEVIRECDSFGELQYWGLYYTSLWDIVRSKQWANEIPENGLGAGKRSPKANKENYKKAWTEERRKWRSELNRGNQYGAVPKPALIGNTHGKSNSGKKRLYRDDGSHYYEKEKENGT